MVAALANPPKTQEVLSTVAEFLEMERRLGERHEYFNGKIVKKAGSSIKHNLITKNIIFLLESHLGEQEDRYVFGSDQKIYLPKFNYYVYPDAVVVSAVPIVSDKDSQAIVNPLLIVEVLSPSTAGHDKSDKFVDYKTLPSFKEYVLVRQDSPEVTTLFREEDNLWRNQDIEGLEQSVFLKSLNISLEMSKIYKKVF